MRGETGTDPPVNGLAGRMACAGTLAVLRRAVAGPFAGRDGQAPERLVAMVPATGARGRTYAARGSWCRFILRPRSRNLPRRWERSDCPAAPARHCGERPAGPGQEP